MTHRIVSLAIVLVVSVAITPSAYGSAARLGVSSDVEVPQAVSVTQAIQEGSVSKDDLRSSSVMFIENVGQWDGGARFQVWGEPTGTMWLAHDAIWITMLEPVLTEASNQVDKAPVPWFRWSSEHREDPAPRRGVNVKVSFVGANPQPRIETFDRLDTVVSYFYGNDPDQWRPDVPVWGGVRYADLYPGIDLEFTNMDRRMASRLTPRPGADLAVVRLRVEGADAVTVDRDALRLSTTAGEYALPLLQVAGSDGEAIVQPRGEQVFDVSTPFAAPSLPTHSSPTTPDSPADNPADLLYGTFLGGSVNEFGHGIAVDEAGSAYLTGSTDSSNFPTTPGAFDPTYNGGDCGGVPCSDTFVVKLNPAGSALAYATFLGGSYSEDGSGIAVDGAGSVYVTGNTNSSNFPATPDAFDTTYNGGYDAFVAKLNPAGGALTYATFLGGNSVDYGYGIAVDGTGSAFVTGETYSTDFPITPGAFAPSFNGGYVDAFVAKLNPAGSALSYATFLGGSGNEDSLGVAVDPAGNVYVTGKTDSGNFPTTPDAFDTTYNGGYYDAFVAKLNLAGSALTYATFLGGSDRDEGHGIAVDGTGGAYVTGGTSSGNFPATPGAFDPSYNGGGYFDTFVARLDPAGSALAYATFLGGDYYEVGRAIVVDGAGSAYVTGLTYSSNFPTTPDAFDTSHNGGSIDTFVAKLNPAGSALTYATFLGGSYSEDSWGIAAGACSAYVTGYTSSSNFPATPGAFDPSYNGNNDAFLAKLAMGGSQPCCDFDGDGSVDVDDLVIIGGLWYQPATAPHDRDCDGLVTIVDIQRVARWWGWPIP